MLVQISVLFWRLSRNVSADISVILTLITALLQIEEGGVKLRYMEKVSILITRIIRIIMFRLFPLRLCFPILQLYY